MVENLGKWAGFEESQENDSAVTQQAIDELDPLIAAGFGVLILQHAGWKADRSRGSSGIEGAVDALLFLDGQGAGRTLTFRGGRLGVDPEPLGFRLGDDGGLDALGPGRPNSVSKMADVLRAFETLEAPVTTGDVADHLGWDERTALRWLKRLEKRLKVHRVERRGGTGGGSHVTWQRGVDWTAVRDHLEATRHWEFQRSLGEGRLGKPGQGR